MSLKQGLNEDEFEKLVELLSRRKEEREGIITDDVVRNSLIELGLSELLIENDIEEVRQQVNRELKKQQRKNYFIFGLILILVTTPLAAYGGYKLKGFIVSNFPQFSDYSEVDSSEKLISLEEKIKELESDIKELESDKAELEERLKASEGENAGSNISSSIANSSSEPTQTTNNLVEHQGLIFKLQECQKSSTSPTTRNITCALLITSTKENSRVYLYSNYSASRKSRIIEAGKENIATRVQLGSDSGNSRADNNLIKDIAMEGAIVFENVPKEVKKIGVIQISSYLESSYYRDELQIEFHNINLSDA